MSRSIVVLALLGLLACKSSEPTGSGGASAPAAGSSTSSTAAAVASAPSSDGHVGIQEATKAFAEALATGDAAKVRAEMPPREVLGKYFACDTISKRIDATAEQAITRPTAAPKGATFVGVEDTQTNVIDHEFDGCKVTEQILVVEVTTKWKLDDKLHMSALQLVRLGKRWYTFDLPAE